MSTQQGGTKGAERPLPDRLRGVFADEVAELQAVEASLREDRERFHEAARAREEALAEAREIGAELDALPVALAQAQLADDEKEGAALRERHARLKARLADEERKRQQAEQVLGGTDPALAESLAHQRAYAVVTELTRGAAERRKELLLALQTACGEFEDRAARLLALGQVAAHAAHREGR